MSAVDVRAKVLGIPDDGRKVIVLIERNHDRAVDWLRQTRELSGGGVLRYRMYQRGVSAEGIRALVDVVIGWRAKPRAADKGKD